MVVSKAKEQIVKTSKQKSVNCLFEHQMGIFQDKFQIVLSQKIPHFGNPVSQASY